MLGIWQRPPATLSSASPFHFDRPSYPNAVNAALESRQHVLLYGRPRQGKSTLVRQLLRDRSCITFHASDDTAFADIFRTYLLTLGVSVTVEQKRKRKLGAKAEVSWKWPLFSAGGSVDGSAENEVTQRSFSVDIGNPNDVCYLLREFGKAPCLVVEHFENMRGKQRRLMLEFLRISAETEVIQIVLIATTLDFPLDHRERIPLWRSLSVIELPQLTREESDRLVLEFLRPFDVPATPTVAELLYETFEGSLEATLGGCAMVTAKPRKRGGPALIGDDLLSRIHEQTQNDFLALIAAIVEADWTFRLKRRVAHQDVNGYWRRTGQVPIADTLARDPVFCSLHDAIAAGAKDRPELPEELKKLVDQSVALGKRMLAVPTESEPVRLVAFALGVLVADPLQPVRRDYVPAVEVVEERRNAGLLLAELLLEAPLDQELSITAETLTARFETEGMETDAKAVGRLARRLRRLQRRLGISPPLIRVADNCERIVLWEPRNFRLLGDVKPRLAQLIDELRDEIEDD